MPLIDVPALRDRVDALLAGVRRSVLRRRRLLSAVLAGGAVLAGLAAVSPPAPATTSVPVAARDLPSGTVLGPGDLTRVALPERQAPDGLVPDPAGRTLAGPLRRGEPVTDVRLVGPALAEAHPGQVVVPVRIPDAGVAALLRVGDRVDVVASDPAGRPGSAGVVAVRATVLALPEGAAAGSSYAPGATGGALVVLAVAPAEATRLLDAGVRSVLSLTISR